MRQSRETCLHREKIIPLGVGYAIKLADNPSAGFVGVPRGGTLFFCFLPLIHLIIVEEGLKMSKKLVSLFLAMLMVFSMTSVLADDAAVTVTDMYGREITLTEPATRIVALQPSDCEILCAIGCEEALVGIGQYCDYPASITSLPKVQSGKETNIEEILALEPQIVLMNDMSQSEDQVKQLEENGVKVVISTTSDIASIYTAIRMIGALMGKDDNAEALIADIQATCDEIRAKTEGNEKSVYFEISPPPYLYSCGSTSFTHELAEICGLKNIFGDQADPWLMISDEQVIERNPDYIILMNGMGAEGIDEIIARDGWGDITAIKDKNIYYDGTSMMTRPGPRLKDAVIELYNFVYGDEAEEIPAA